MKLLHRPASFLQGMAVGPDGRVWLGTNLGFDIVSNDGQVASLTVPDAKDGFRSVAAGGDGNVWAVIEKPLHCLSPCYFPDDPPAEPWIARAQRC